MGEGNPYRRLVKVQAKRANSKKGWREMSCGGVGQVGMKVANERERALPGEPVAWAGGVHFGVGEPPTP